MFAQNNR